MNEGGSPLYYAAKYNNDKIIRLLISSGAKVNTLIESGLTALTALDIALYTNSDKAIDVLREYHGKTNAELSLLGSVQSGSVFWVNKHLINGANPNLKIKYHNGETNTGMPILHYALAYGFDNIAKIDKTNIIDIIATFTYL